MCDTENEDPEERSHLLEHRRTMVKQVQETGLFVWAHLSKTNQAAEAAGRDHHGNGLWGGGGGGEKKVLPSEILPTTRF